MGMVGLLNRDITSVHVVAESFQPRRIIENSTLNEIGFLDPPIADFHWQLHALKLSRIRASEKQNCALNLLQRPEMRGEFGRLDLHQVGINVFHDALADRRRKKIDNRVVDFRRRSEGPGFLSVA
jgi:hypothetical protein